MSDLKPDLVVSADGKIIKPAICDPMSTIKTVCAWCGAHIKGDPDALHTSHSICPSCKSKEIGESGG
jgi:predicted Zn-ribbon and HTH transcriptional regulator